MKALGSSPPCDFVLHGRRDETGDVPPCSTLLHLGFAPAVRTASGKKRPPLAGVHRMTTSPAGRYAILFSLKSRRCSALSSDNFRLFLGLYVREGCAFPPAALALPVVFL